MTLVTSNHSQVTGYHTHRLLSTILIVALGCLIGIVFVLVSVMPDRHNSSYLSGLWTHSDKHIGISSSSVLMQTESPKTDIAQLRGSVTDEGGQPIEDASIAMYKSGRMISSADKQGGFTGFTSSDKYGMHSLGALQSGIYDTKFTYPDEIVSTIENYAEWPSSNSSFNFVK